MMIYTDKENERENIEKSEKEEIVLKNKHSLNTIINISETENKKEFATIGKNTDQNITIQNSYLHIIERSLAYFNNDDSLIQQHSFQKLTSFNNKNEIQDFNISINNKNERSKSAKLLRINRNKIYKNLNSKQSILKNQTLESFDLSIEYVNGINSPECIRNYSKTRKRSVKKLLSTHKSNKNETDCGICYGPFEDPINMECCNKKFCKDCIKSLITDGLKNYNSLYNKNNENDFIIFSCPNKECRKQLSKKFIRDLLTGENLAKFNKIYDYLEIVGNKENILCPIPDCDSYAKKIKEKKNKLICIKNNHEFCVRCLKAYHKDSCIIDKIIDEKEAVKKKMKKCPSCKIWIEKNHGCNHMTCRNVGCGYEFCWICLGKYSSNHYKNPFTPCFRRSNDDVTNNSFINNRCYAIIRAIGILFLFLLVISLTLSLLSIAISILTFIWVAKDFYRYRVHLKTSCRELFLNIIHFFAYFWIGVAYFNLGFLIIAVLIGTCPGWVSVILCYRCHKYYYNKRGLISRRRNLNIPNDRLIEPRPEAEVLIAPQNLQISPPLPMSPPLLLPPEAKAEKISLHELLKEENPIPGEKLISQFDENMEKKNSLNEESVCLIKSNEEIMKQKNEIEIAQEVFD